MAPNHKRAPRVSVTVTSAFVPSGHDDDAALDALGRRIASGDRAAEPLLESALHALISSLVAPLMAQHHLRPHRENFEREALLTAIRYTRRYDGVRPLRPFLKTCIRLDLKALARQHLSKIGGKVPTRGMLDLNEPFFRPTKGIAAAALRPAPAAGSAGGGGGFAVNVRSVWLTGAAAARHRLMNRLRRCTLFEKEVLLQIWGIPAKPASRNAYTAAAAEAAKPATLEEIAASHGVGVEVVAAARDSGLWKIGTDMEAETAGE